MVGIEDLIGISEDKRKEIFRCLDDLMTFKNSSSKLAPVISGYNWYHKIVGPNRIITFSHIHETEAYKQDMLKDLVKLGYDSNTILEYVRDKAGTLLWNLRYKIRDDRGNVLQGLKIRDIRTGEYIDLNEYVKPLSKYREFRGSKGCLIAEDQGWQLDTPFRNKNELLSLVNLFLKKSGEHTYDKNGAEIPESEEERMLRAPWTDAYEAPVLIIGEGALMYSEELPQFNKATKMCLIENNNEISFIVHKKLEFLKNLSHYEKLRMLGFNEELCLGNKPFLEDIDEKTR